MQTFCVWMLLSSSFVAATESHAASCPPVRGGRLVVSTRSEAKHFNPLIAVDQPTKTVQSLLMADLLHINRRDHETYPNVASAWEVSDDGRVYTLTLRSGLKFSDGHPVSIDDVLFSFRVYLDESVHSPQRDLLLVGGEPMRVAKLDGQRARFILSEPYAAGERLFDSFHILPRHLLGPAYEKGEIASAWGLLAKPNRVAGLGPFRLKRVVPGERIVLERNPHYWKKSPSGEPLPYLDEVVFLLLPNEEAELLRFKSGDVDIIERVDPRNFDALENDDSGYRMVDLGPGLEYHFLFFNLNDSAPATHHARQAWFANPAFRRAVSAAIDRRAMIDLVYEKRAAELATHVSPGNSRWVNRDLKNDAYSVERARELFSEAGFRWDPNGLMIDSAGAVVTFSVLTNAGNRKRALMASLIQEDLARVGIEVRMAPLEFRSYVDRIFQTHDFDSAILALVSGDADPNPEMSVLLSDGGTHVWHLGQKSPATDWERDVDRLMRKQLVTLDTTKRKSLYDRVQRIMFEYRPLITLLSPHVLVGAHEKLGNFAPGILPPYTLWNVDELYWRHRSSP